MSFLSPRVAVIGDVAGHPRPLLRLLAGLGAEVDPGAVGTAAGKLHGAELANIEMVWPEDLHVVSVGDLVHRGPDSSGVIMLVDRLVREGRWTPVVGNHEQIYVDREIFEWPERIDDDAAAILRDWWGNGLMHASVAINTDTGRDRIVCHGGLTAGFWQQNGSPRTADEAAAAVRASGDALWTPGLMLGYEPNMAAGPVWAESAMEVALSWLASPESVELTEFDQFHGHTSPMRWSTKLPHNPELAGIMAEYGSPILVDFERLHTHINIRSQLITGVDPGHGQRPRSPWAAAVVDGTVVLPA